QTSVARAITSGPTVVGSEPLWNPTTASPACASVRASPDTMIAAADLLETATTRTTARTIALTRAYPAVGSEGVANTYAMANTVLTSALIEATTTRRTAGRPTVTASLLFSMGRLL